MESGEEVSMVDVRDEKAIRRGALPRGYEK